MQTNLLGKWGVVIRHGHNTKPAGVISAVTMTGDSGYLYLYLLDDKGTLNRVDADNVQVFERRPDDSGPYR